MISSINFPPNTFYRYIILHQEVNSNIKRFRAIFLRLSTVAYNCGLNCETLTKTKHFHLRSHKITVVYLTMKGAFF